MGIMKRNAQRTRQLPVAIRNHRPRSRSCNLHALVAIATVSAPVPGLSSSAALDPAVVLDQK
jgi:hypothetical protein